MSYKPIQSVDYLVVHCADTPAKMDIGVTEIRQWHRDRGWFDVGYHFVIRRDGEVEIGRPIDRPGAHARGFNGRSLGICLVGGRAAFTKLPEANFTDAQFESLGVLINQMLSLFPDAEVLGHRDLPDVSKACPSFDVGFWWRQYNEEQVDEDDQSEEDTRPIVGEEDQVREAKTIRHLCSRARRGLRKVRPPR